MTKKIIGLLGGALSVGAFGLLYYLERRRPLRASVESKVVRNARNLGIAAVSAAALQLLERPLIQPLAALVETRRWGLLQRLPLPAWLQRLLAVALMDYTLYHWHVLNHRVPWLWRCHIVHHADLDLDASTALRFHFAELALSIPWRVAQVLVLGVGPLALTVWQNLLMLSILFHHSNVRLPLVLERRLNWFIVTPRLHGIHHSIVRDETDSNWSSGLTVWDRLHGTLRRDVPQEAITIGVPAYREPAQITLGEMLKLPFVTQPPTWELADGSHAMCISSQVTQ